MSLMCFIGQRFYRNGFR